MTRSNVRRFRLASAAVCLSILGFVVLCPAPIVAQGSGKVIGTWNVAAETDNGQQTYALAIKRAGDELTGHIAPTANDSRFELENVKFDGEKLTFGFDLEFDGDEMKISVVTLLSGGKLNGTWKSSDDSGNELGSGNVVASKVKRVRFAGTWTSVATLPSGETHQTELKLAGKNSNLSGSVNSESGTTKLDKVSAKDKNIRLELKIDVEGGKRDVVIESELDSNDSLVGTWSLLDDSGDEEASGDWKATRESAGDSGVEILFDGTSLDNFRGYAEQETGHGWKIEGDDLKLDGQQSGDIVTKKEYGNFELEFDWKISEGGNSGVMYRVSLGDRKPYLTGPEYQVLDDARHKDGADETRTTGSLYALYKPVNKTLHPVGEWNTSKIVLNGNNVEHWLNGTKVVEAEFGSDDWNEKVAASKFKDWEKFGKNKKGHIAFQDHGNLVWYRNIKVTPLK